MPTSNWRQWSLDDYCFNFLSKRAASARLYRSPHPAIQEFDDKSIKDFLAPIRSLIAQHYSNPRPLVSIILRCHNEENELVPTLLSYAMSPMVGTPAELIVVNNASTDRSRQILEGSGVRVVDCPKKGIGYATRAGYLATNPHSEYIFISDSDVRITAPFRYGRDFCPGTPLITSLNYLRSHNKVMGVSTGMRYETSHWSHRLLRYINAVLRRKPMISFWSGANQFFRRELLEAIGGINEHIEYGFGEDFYRLYTASRYCKERRLELHSGAMTLQLADPVYTSGRRFASLALTYRNTMYLLRRKRRELGDDGWPVFRENGAVTKEEIRT